MLWWSNYQEFTSTEDIETSNLPQRSRMILALHCQLNIEASNRFRLSEPVRVIADFIEYYLRLWRSRLFPIFIVSVPDICWIKAHTPKLRMIFRTDVPLLALVKFFLRFLFTRFASSGISFGGSGLGAGKFSHGRLISVASIRYVTETLSDSWRVITEVRLS
jgi:hypothetical protein